MDFVKLRENIVFHLLNGCGRKVQEDFVLLARTPYSLRGHRLHGVIEIPAGLYASDKHAR